MFHPPQNPFQFMTVGRSEVRTEQARLAQQQVQQTQAQHRSNQRGGLSNGLASQRGPHDFRRQGHAGGRTQQFQVCLVHNAQVRKASHPVLRCAMGQHRRRPGGLVLVEVLGSIACHQ